MDKGVTELGEIISYLAYPVGKLKPLCGARADTFMNVTCHFVNYLYFEMYPFIIAQLSVNKYSFLYLIYFLE